MRSERKAWDSPGFDRAIALALAYVDEAISVNTDPQVQAMYPDDVARSLADLTDRLQAALQDLQGKYMQAEGLAISARSFAPKSSAHDLYC